MRLDKFLKITRVIKRRTVAKELADNGNIIAVSYTHLDVYKRQTSSSPESNGNSGSSSESSSGSSGTKSSEGTSE